MRIFAICWFLTILSIFTFGCSNNNPATLKIQSSDPDFAFSSSHFGVGVSDYDKNGSAVAGQGSMGIFHANIDPGKLTGELISIRSSNSTDVIEILDITNFLQYAPCNYCAKILGISLNSNENLVVKIGIKHPFKVGDPLKPISGINRADLHVFNIEGIVVADGSGSVDFPILGKSIGSVNLLNADGFTSYLDNSLDAFYPTAADVHPYVLHFDDYSSGNYDPMNPMGFASVTNPPPSGNLVMAMGSDYDVQDYVFDNSTTAFEFIFTVGCSYGISTMSMSHRFSPEYRVPQHLKKAASEVSIEITRNDLAAGSPTSDADIEVSVVDISHGVAVGTSLDEMLTASDVESVAIEIPGIIFANVVFSTPVSGTGHDPTDPLIYQFTIQNEQNASSGTYDGLVKVLDTYSSGQNQALVLDGMDGIKRVLPIENPINGLFMIDEFATYQRFTIAVELQNTPPTVGPVEGCDEVIAGIPNTFTVVASDPDSGQSLTYNWDNGENTPGVYDDGTAMDDGSIELTFINGGNYTVDVQVDDGFGGVTTSSNPLDVEVLASGVFVNADYTGGTSDGTIDYPYKTIQDGIDNTTSSGNVFVLPATNTYSVFRMNSSNSVIGYDLDCGTDRPTVYMTYSYSFGSNISDIALKNFIFDFDIDSIGIQEIVAFSNVTNGEIQNCRFTGESQANTTRALRLDNFNNSIVHECEFVDIEIDGAPVTGHRYAYILHASASDTFTIMHNEFHDLSIPDLGPDANWSGIWNMLLVNNSNLVVKNNLIYDISDYSPAQPRNVNPHSCNVLHGFQIGGSSGYEFNHNTIDNLNAIASDPNENGWSVGFYGTADGAHTNNIFKSLHYFTNSGGGHNDAGFWADGAPTTTANYCTVYWGDLATPPTQCKDYLNRISQGTGSYGMYADRQDPDFDYTVGPDFYHPQNTVIATGADDGSEMGCFGGTDGNWTPPSLIYP